jgi:hypothetical protein
VNDTTQYIINVSGGLTSYEALRRTIARHGRDAVRAVFADTLIEHADLYRFLTDTERLLGVAITRLADGRDPWQVMKDRRAITMQGAAPCSQELKRKVIDRWVGENFEPGTYTRVFGMDWSEMARMERLKAELAPVPVWFPLAEPPYVDKCHIAADLEMAGVETPYLYRIGFTHNNCGGGCVKAGQAHWAHLWHVLPDTYALWEAKEDGVRQHLGKDVTILKDRRGGGPRKPMTLAAFRARLEMGEAYETDEWGGCGCFAPSVAALPMFATAKSVTA